MYPEAYIWNVCVGCLYQCKYCIPSFQKQMKRQKPIIDKNGKKRGCLLCYNYYPHFHPERLNINFNQKRYQTIGDRFIWVCSSGDITFAKKEWMEQILEKVREYKNRTFFFQSKNPAIFNCYDFPENVLLGTTIESNRDYITLSNAPKQSKRYNDFLDIEFPRKLVTIEPILQFDLYTFVKWNKNINPEWVYVGYDTRNCGLIEPRISQTLALINELKKFTKVKTKYMKGLEGKINEK